MKMTPSVVVIGSLLVFWASAALMVFMPIAMMWDIKPSDQWIPLSKDEKEGLNLYKKNGCSYCHSLYIRVNDWYEGTERISQAGDYNEMQPVILGTERTGPDLSQEGGLHTDDWQRAHFINPRTTSPLSLMPRWEFLGNEKIDKLIAYVQSLGGKNAKVRVARQKFWKALSVAAFKAGPDSNISWIHHNVPEVWRPMPNPYPADDAELESGTRVYEQYCVNCHGLIGDGRGAAAQYLCPPPLNFTELRRNLIENKYIGGIFYYQIMNGITGTAMPFFKKHLESDKIWKVSNYVAVYFVGYTDANLAPKGIDASYETIWRNPYPQPDTAKEKP